MTHLKNYAWLFVYSYELHKLDFNFIEIQNIKSLLHACRNLKQSTSTQGMKMILCLLPCYTKFRKRSIICPSYHILYWKDIFFCYIFVCMQGYRGWYTYDPFNNRFQILWHGCRWLEKCHFVNDISQLPYQQYPYPDSCDKKFTTDKPCERIAYFEHWNVSNLQYGMLMIFCFYLIYIFNFYPNLEN